MEHVAFQALFEHSSIGIIISNQDGIIERSNPFAAKIFGYGSNELIGQYVEILIPAQLREKHIIYRKKYNDNPQPRSMGSSLNLMAVKKDGSQFPVEVSLSFFESGGKRRIVSFVNDITERKYSDDQLKKLTEELESKVHERTKELSDTLWELNTTNKGLQDEMEQRKKAEKQMLVSLEKEKELNELKSRFVSMASHEFRTPLSGILTSASLISQYTKEEDFSKRIKHINTIKKLVRNLTNILNDFLSLDKLEQGNTISHASNFSIREVLDEIAEEFKEIAEKQPLKIQHHHKDLILHQDKQMFRNVIINLLSNAFKYSPDLGTVCLKTYPSEGNILIEISDQGIGIPVQEQKHIFERFFRANNATTISGTGLGLNIVKRYLDLMNGSIKFISRENEGTTFTVTLPLEKEK